MTPAAEKLLSKIRKALEDRGDVLLLDLPAAKGQPSLAGIITRRFEITRTIAASSFQPLVRTTPEAHGIAFAIEANVTRTLPTRTQKDWREDWGARGCIFIEAASPQDVWDVLGPETLIK